MIYYMEGVENKFDGKRVYINHINNTLGQIERLEDGIYRITFSEEYKIALDNLGLERILEEGEYKELPKELMRRIPPKGTQNEMFQRKIWGYEKEEFDPLYWLGLCRGIKNENLYNFTFFPLDTEKMKIVLKDKGLME